MQLIVLIPKGFCKKPGYPGKTAGIPGLPKNNFPHFLFIGRLQFHFLGSCQSEYTGLEFKCRDIPGISPIGVKDLRINFIPCWLQIQRSAK